MSGNLITHINHLPMKREKITISNNGIFTIPDASSANILLRDFEIAELLEITLPAIKSNIRTILKSGIVTTDVTNGATLVGNNILPDYYGLDMIIALAFRIHSHNAQLFRKYIIQCMSSIQNQRIIKLYVSVNRESDQKQSKYPN